MKHRDRLIGLVMGVLLSTGIVLALGLTRGTASAGGPAGPAPQEDFMFQVNGFHTNLQGGQTINFYLHYRYRTGLPASQYPDYRLVRTMLLNYMEHQAPPNAFWEVMNTQICTRILHSFPFQAISCQFQVDSNNSPKAYEPGFHGSIVTLGNIEPLAVPGR